MNNHPHILRAQAGALAFLTFFNMRRARTILKEERMMFPEYSAMGKEIESGSPYLIFVVYIFQGKPSHYRYSRANLKKIQTYSSLFKVAIAIFSFPAKVSACLRSSTLGLPLLIPPKYLRKLLVLKPVHWNSSTIL